jgi:GTP cyclohydrolase I
VVNSHLIEKGVRMILAGMGVSQQDKNFTETPERVARFYQEMFNQQETEWATFPEEYSDFIMLRGHKLWTLCPHHLLPVEMNVTVAYIPNGQVLGLSKLARVMSECNNLPLLQEKFTKDVLTKINLITGRTCLGAACLVEGQHGCTKIRGVHSEGWFVTYKFEGVFDEQVKLQDRFMRLAQTR